jgi:hypothetical protein
VRPSLLGIIEGDGPFQVGAGVGKISEEEQRLPQRVVGDNKARRIVHTLYQEEAVLCQLPRLS